MFWNLQHIENHSKIENNSFRAQNNIPLVVYMKFCFYILILYYKMYIQHVVEAKDRNFP